MDIIIGGGITGLSYTLFKGNNDYLILEREPDLGGYCRTTKRNGFVWDYSGHFFHFQDQGIKESIMDAEIDGQLVKVDKVTSIKYGDRLIDYPFQKNIHQLPPQEFIDCLVDLFETDKNKAYHSFKEMLYCKFGKSIAEKFLIPYNEKLYACDLNRLDKEAMGRFFPYAEKEDIIRNFKTKNNITYNGSFLYPRGGAIEYVNAVLRHITDPQIRKNCNVKSIDANRKVVILDTGEEIAYNRLISTMPFPILLNKAEIAYDKDIYSWNQVLVFNLGFNKKGPEVNNHWIYSPNKDYSFYRVGFYDNILSQDRTSLYVELGFNKDAVINPDDYLDKVLNDLRDAGFISSDMELVDYESIIMDPAYVHITEASTADVANKKQQLANMDIYSIGRYGSWTYCSIEDNIKEALELANQLNTDEK